MYIKRNYALTNKYREMREQKKKRDNNDCYCLRIYRVHNIKRYTFLFTIAGVILRQANICVVFINGPSVLTLVKYGYTIKSFLSLLSTAPLSLLPFSMMFCKILCSI